MVVTTRPISCLTDRSRSGRAELSAEILRDDDVGGLLRPGLRNLDVPLLEDHLSTFVADHGGAQLPLDVVERVHARAAEIAGERRGPVRGRVLGNRAGRRRRRRPAHRQPWSPEQRESACVPPNSGATSSPRCVCLKRSQCGLARFRRSPLVGRRAGSWDVPARCRSPARRSGTMRLARCFVKQEHTTYCGRVLGQSQDVPKTDRKCWGWARPTAWAA